MAESKKILKLQTIGRHVLIDLPDLHSFGIEAKVDTGAFRTVVHCLSCKEITTENGNVLEAVFCLDNKTKHKIHFKNFFQREFKSSFGEIEKRYCVQTTIRIGGKKIHSSISLTDRSDMRFQVLIGRKTLLRKFLVDVSKKIA